MILFKTGGRREVNISIFFCKPERRFTESRKMKKSKTYSMITRESTKTCYRELFGVCSLNNKELRWRTKRRKK